MMRVVALAAGSQYAIYLEREAVEEAYWQGRGAELLQLEWEHVRSREFAALTKRIHPRTGEVLKPAHGQQITFYDVTVHAPKSVSITSLVDERLVSAHRVATAYLMDRMEHQSGVWIDRSIQPTRNLIMASYEHRQSRAPDIHLHTHVPVINLTYHEETQSWKALQAQPIFFSRHHLTEQYREALACRIEDLGYKLMDKERVGFEIEGVSKEIIDRYSQRSIKIKHRLQTEDRCMTVSNVGWWTRDKDKKVQPPDEFRERQLSRLAPTERGQLLRIRDEAYERKMSARLRLHISDDAHDEGPQLKHWTYGQRISM